MFRRIGVVAALVGLVAAACGNDSATTTTTGAGQGTTTTGAAATGASTFEVQVDHTGKDFPVAMTAYFPQNLQARSGDTVRFRLANPGEPHTVTLGTLVDKGFEAAARQPEDSFDEPPELAEVLPDLITDPSRTPGPPTAVQYAAQPCFLETGTPPTDPNTACPKASQPKFNGKQALVNSGWMDKDEVFTLQLADDIAPGTYTYFCLLHRQGMTGKLEVKAKGATVPSADDVKKAAQAEIDTEVATQKKVFDQATASPIGQIQAGGFSFEDEDARGQVTAFVPKEFSAKVGDKVTWGIIGPHSITINGSESLRTIRKENPDGSVVLNQEAVGPINSEGMPPPPPGAGEEEGPPGGESPPPEEQGPPTPEQLLANAVDIAGGEYDGTGVKNSGLVLSFGEPLFTYSVTFTNAGTYNYFCVVHPDMEGTVKVT